MWEMIHESNAIEAFALVVTFSEPVGTIPFRKLLNAAETNASGLGFIDRNQVEEVQVDIGPNGASKRVLSTGMVFQRRSLFKGSEGAVEQKLAEQLHLAPTQLIYQNWKYESWTKTVQVLNKLVQPAFDRATETVAVKSVRLEYLDRFMHHGSGLPLFSDLLNVDILPRPLQTADDLWHSHMGWFSENGDEVRLLKQINCDYQEISQPHTWAGRRGIGLMTAVERQYMGAGKAFDEDQVGLEELLIPLHAEVFTLFEYAMNEEFRKLNRLHK